MHSSQSFNTAVSFVTNTTGSRIQARPSGFCSDGRTGCSELLVSRSRYGGGCRLDSRIHPHRTDRLGNFWWTSFEGRTESCYQWRSLFAIVLLISGVVQNFADTTVTTLAGGDQILPGGPVASQEAIKDLGIEWWRLLQCELCASVREPNAPDEPALRSLCCWLSRLACLGRLGAWWDRCAKGSRSSRR